MVQSKLEPIPERLNIIGDAIVDSAFTVHTKLGPGLLESVYEVCMMVELEKRGFKVRRQVPVALHYEGVTFVKAYEIDLLVEESVIVEIKSIEALNPIHAKQLLTHLKLAGHRLGYLINFNVPLIKDGIIRRVI